MRPYTAHLFMPLGTAFHFRVAPPDDILDPKYLASDAPDDILASVLAHAQRGAFEATDRLVDLMRDVDEAMVWIGCTALLAHAAPARVLRRMITALEGGIAEDPSTAWWIAGTLGASGCLWAAPEMLRLYTLVEDRGNVRWIPSAPELSLSAMLEPYNGEIADGAPLVPQPGDEWWSPEPVYDHDAFRRRVTARIDELRARCPDPERDALFAGELRDPRRVAEELLAGLVDGGHHPVDGRMEDMRMLLEATSGVDLQGFYQELRFQPDEAARLVRGMLDSGALDGLRPGARYFFGREIRG